MKTIKINGRNCRELAEEFAGIVGKSVHFNQYGNRLEFDMEDAAELVSIADSARRYWLSIGKRAKSEAANTIREKVNELVISGRYAASF